MKLSEHKHYYLIILLILGITFQTHAQTNATTLRLDMDEMGFYLWCMGNTKIGKTDLAHEIIYFPATNDVEIDVGPQFTFGKSGFSALPMAGIILNVPAGKLNYFVPQLHMFYNTDKLHGEYWNLYFHGIHPESKDASSYYSRFFVTYKLCKWIALGPHVEYTIKETEKDFKLSSFQFGLATDIPYGEKYNWTIFLGVDERNKNKFVSRFTFLINL